jgi:hypothetical protein
LNETAYGEGLVARGKHWLIFGKNSENHPSLVGQERLLQNQVLMSNWLFFDDAKKLTYNDWKTKYTNEVTFSQKMYNSTPKSKLNFSALNSWIIASTKYLSNDV